MLAQQSFLSLNLRLQCVLDHAVERRGFFRRLGLPLLGDEGIALLHQRRQFVVQRLAGLHLLVEFGLTFFGREVLQSVRQVFILQAGKLFAA